MGVVMKLRGLSELGQGRWSYRRRVPKSAKAALGKSEWKRVIKARSDADLMRQYALVEAEFDREVAAAKAPPKKLTPRVAWEAALFVWVPSVEQAVRKPKSTLTVTSTATREGDRWGILLWTLPSGLSVVGKGDVGVGDIPYDLPRFAGDREGVVVGFFDNEY